MAEGSYQKDGLTLAWPRLEGTSPGVKRINRYYDALADRWRRHWEREPGLRAGLTYQVTLLTEELFSLWWEATEDRGERRPRRVRQGDVWRLPWGEPVTLRELLPRRRWWKGPVLDEIRRQIGSRVQAGDSLFYPDWLSLASRRFCPSRFYLTEEGPVVFYPMETIAPALEGFPSFSLRALQKKTSTN